MGIPVLHKRLSMSSSFNLCSYVIVKALYKFQVKQVLSIFSMCVDGDAAGHVTVAGKNLGTSWLY